VRWAVRQRLPRPGITDRYGGYGSSGAGYNRYGSYGTRYYGSGYNGYGSYGPQYYGSDYNGSGSMELAITDTVGRDADLCGSVRDIFKASARDLPVPLV
jgi:hypothetical protein